MSYLITGVAGFVGSSLALRLLGEGRAVVGIDNLDPYYDPAIKRANLKTVGDKARELGGSFSFLEADIRDAAAVESLFSTHKPKRVAHLAAMSGVRYSSENGALYADVNVKGGVNLLDAARRWGVEVFAQASTSNVYGMATTVPFREDQCAEQPLSPYPASKRSAELFAHSYHQLYGLQTTVLRFFNVYGPRGRVDMMPFKVLDAIVKRAPITVYDLGMKRDWTFIEDILDGVRAALERPLGFQIINLGRGEPVALRDFIQVCEGLVGRPAELKQVETPLTEAPITFCDNTRARKLLDFDPKTPLQEGMALTWEWYQRAILPSQQPRRP